MFLLLKEQLQDSAFHSSCCSQVINSKSALMYSWLFGGSSLSCWSWNMQQVFQVQPGFGNLLS